MAVSIIHSVGTRVARHHILVVLPEQVKHALLVFLASLLTQSVLDLSKGIIILFSVPTATAHNICIYIWIVTCLLQTLAEQWDLTSNIQIFLLLMTRGPQEGGAKHIRQHLCSTVITRLQTLKVELDHVRVVGTKNSAYSARRRVSVWELSDSSHVTPLWVQHVNFFIPVDQKAVWKSVGILVEIGHHSELLLPFGFMPFPSLLFKRSRYGQRTIFSSADTNFSPAVASTPSMNSAVVR